MAKILISSIGTGRKEEGGYRKAKYEFNGKIIETPFISKALCEFLDIDKLFLVGTKGSIWDSVYTEFGGEDPDIELKLYEQQENKNLTQKDLSVVEETIQKSLKMKGSRCFLIEYGIDDKELWSNFSIYLQILGFIENGDEVYIDISHAFRSLALMSFLMVQFGQTIEAKKFSIEGIYYGMLEYARENNGITPIVNLKIFYDLLEWMKAIENLTQYGNANKIVNLLDNKEEKNLFNHFSLSLRMANLEAIYKNVKHLSKKISKIEASPNPIVKLLAPELKSFIHRLDHSTMSHFQLSIAEWFWEHKHYALSYIALIESIVTKICELQGYDSKDENARKKAKKEISRFDKTLFYDIYQPANRIRNDIAHQIGKRNDSLLQDARNLKNYIQKTKKIFQKLSQ